MTETMIRFESVTKRFRGVTAVDALDFEVAAGRIVAFLGPNGAGKTTTLRILLGLATASSGRATVVGRRYADLDAPAEAIGAVLDRPQFHPGRTGRDHLRVLAMAGGLSPARVDEVLDLVELRADGRRRVREYSLGMRQRLSIAGALLGRPRVLVLDEPANGLDPRGHRWLQDLLRSERERGTAVLISSHHIVEVQQIVDDVVIIDRGRTVAQGCAAELTGRSTTAVRVQCSDPRRLVGALAREGVSAELRSTGEVVARDVETTRVGDVALRDGVSIHRMETDGRTLEDIFLQLTEARPEP